MRSASKTCTEIASLASLSTYTQWPLGWHATRVGPEPSGSASEGPALGVSMPVPTLKVYCDTVLARALTTNATCAVG